MIHMHNVYSLGHFLHQMPHLLSIPQTYAKGK